VFQVNWVVTCDEWIWLLDLSLRFYIRIFESMLFLCLSVAFADGLSCVCVYLCNSNIVDFAFKVYRVCVFITACLC